MINNFLILLCMLLAAIHHWIKRNQYSKTNRGFVSFLFSIFMLGLVGLIGFISHVFYADQTARMIG